MTVFHIIGKVIVQIYTNEGNDNMCKKIYFLFLGISLFLVGRNIVNADSTSKDITTSINVSFSKSTSNTPTTENINKAITPSVSVADSKEQIIIPDLPDDFVECTKYIGQDISTLDIDVDQWDLNTYMQEVGKSSLYGKSGTVSMRLGWDNATIIHVAFRLDDGEYIQGDEYTDISNKLEEIFGESILVSDGITNYQGKSDYAFRLLRGGAGIAWNTEKQEQFDKSNPENNESDVKVIITEEPRRSPEIGMTAVEVKNSTWGDPTDINKTTTKYGVREQWVYRFSSKTKYIYLEDGVVTIIQE